MKPNKDTNYNEFIEWSEKLCEKRHDKLIELRKEKCGNNLFKKWFYLGKKVKATKYKIIRFRDEIHFNCELINAYNFEDYYEWKCGIDILKDNPNSDWYKEREEKHNA